MIWGRLEGDSGYVAHTAQAQGVTWEYRGYLRMIPVILAVLTRDSSGGY